MLLFALATWILIMAWMSRYSHLGGAYPNFPSGLRSSRARADGQAPASARSGTTR